MSKPIVALTIGDPAGIGPEIALKSLLDERVPAVCRPLLIGDAGVVDFYLRRLELPLNLNKISAIGEARFAAGVVDFLPVETTPAAGLLPDTVVPGTVIPNTVIPNTAEPAHGAATLAYARRAVALAAAGEVDAVVAGPHTQKAIAAAGIPFDGYPGFVARETGTPPDGVFLMLVSDERRIVHATLHVSLREALNLIRRERIVKALDATDGLLRRLGTAKPRIAVAGVNPHAGEGGLFGREEIDHVAPAVEAAREKGVDAHGPFGADTMFLKTGFDAFLVMYHDQGHIPGKLAGFDQTTAFTIGTPVTFATVGHGSGRDIAGNGLADPSSLIRALQRVSSTAPR